MSQVGKAGGSLRRWAIRKLGGYATVLDYPGKLVVIPDDTNADVVWLDRHIHGPIVKGAEVGIVFAGEYARTPFRASAPVV